MLKLFLTPCIYWLGASVYTEFFLLWTKHLPGRGPKKPVSCRNPESLFFLVTQHSFQLLLFLHLCSWKGMSFYRKRSCPRANWNFMFELVILLHDECPASMVLQAVAFFFPLGTCWPSLWRSESLELVLGGWRFHLQVLWSDPDWSLPQDHQAEPRYPMDHQARPQAQGDARADVSRAQEPRAWQGPQIPPHHRWLAPCGLEKAQHPAAAPLPLTLVNRAV